KAHGQLVELDDMAGLLSGGGGDPALRAEVLKAKADTERRMVAARSALPFGLAPTPGMEVNEDVKDAVRTAVLKEGMGWSERNPMFAITLRGRAGGSGKRTWWSYQQSMGFT